MSGFFDSLYNKASQLANDVSKSVSEACDSVKETAGKVFEELKGAAHDASNTARNVVNTAKYGLTAVATATLTGTGQLIKSVKNGAIDLCDEAAAWAKPLAKCGALLKKVAWPLKALSIGEAAIELGTEHKTKKSCEVGCSMALGAGAAMAATALLAATPVGWAAAGVFVVGAAGAWAGDWIGSKIGDWIDGPKEVPAMKVTPPVTPPVTNPGNIQQPAEEVRKGEPAQPLEIRKAEPAIPLEYRKALMPNEPFKSTSAEMNASQSTQLASVSPLDVKLTQTNINTLQLAV